MPFINYRNPCKSSDDDSSSIASHSVNSDEKYTSTSAQFIAMNFEKLMYDMQELKEIVLTLATKITALESNKYSVGSSSVIIDSQNIANGIVPENENIPRSSVRFESSNINFDEEEKISKFLWSELKALPEFDNWSITVKSFILLLEKSIGRIPRQYHTRFARLIRAHKIRPNEKRLLEGYDTTHMEELIEVLRTQFGEFKTLDVVQTERNICFQKPNEGIIEYNKRFMTCQIAVERAVSNKSNLTPEHKRYTLIDDRQTGLNLYLRGLKESLRIMVTANRPATLKEAQDLALNEERTAHAAQIARQQAFGINRFPRLRPMHPRPMQTRPMSVTPARNQATRTGNGIIYRSTIGPNKLVTPTPSPLKCYRCHGINHFARDCPNFSRCSELNTTTRKQSSHEISYIELTEQQPPNSSSAYSTNPSDFWQTPELESTSLKDDTQMATESLKTSEILQE
ncbi:hypothetical protein ANTQUA_LOCUS2228 [Anthophora quadrimaculata]